MTERVVYITPEGVAINFIPQGRHIGFTLDGTVFVGYYGAPQDFAFRTEVSGDTFAVTVDAQFPVAYVCIKDGKAEIVKLP